MKSHFVVKYYINEPNNVKIELKWAIINLMKKLECHYLKVLDRGI